MNELPWMVTAKALIGTHEKAGLHHNPIIVRMWTAIHAPFSDDETPWCAAFVGAQFEGCGIRSSRSAGALSYREWGWGLHAPAYGCVAVKKRYNMSGKLVGGHVTFVAGRNHSGALMCLGGNQGDAVRISAYTAAAFTDYRWPYPPKMIPEPDYTLPLIPDVVQVEGEA